MAGLSSSRCNYVNLVFLLVLVPFSLQIGFDKTPPLSFSLIFILIVSPPWTLRLSFPPQSFACSNKWEFSRSLGSCGGWGFCEPLTPTWIVCVFRLQIGCKTITRLKLRTSLCQQFHLYLTTRCSLLSFCFVLRSLLAGFPRGLFLPPRTFLLCSPCGGIFSWSFR